MADLVDQLLPVGTLLLGAWVTRLGRRGDARRTAADQLTEVRKRVWTRGGDEDWVDLQVYFGRLHVGLRAAGVPQRLIDKLLEAAESHWRKLEDSGDPEVGWIIDHDSRDKLLARESDVLDWLDRPWHVLRRVRAWRRASDGAQQT